MTSKSVWETLSTIDVNDHAEEKNGFTYLSWAWAWGTLKRYYPDATFIKHIQPDGRAYISDEQGHAFVQVTVSAGGESATELYPVLDYRNKSVQHPNTFDVNTAFQRGLTKAMAYLGLGFYIYAGEDLPETTTHEFKEFKVGNEDRIGTMINTFAWNEKDRVPRSFFYWDDWADVCCAWLDSARNLNEKRLMEFYNVNRPVIELAKDQSSISYDSVMAKLTEKKNEIKGAKK